MHQELCPLIEQGPEGQRATFAYCANRFKDVYDSLPEDPQHLVTDFWKEKNAQLVAEWLPSPPYEFLRNSVIAWTMFVPYSKFTPGELATIRETFDDSEVVNLLSESHVGMPRTFGCGGVETSGNTVHHLHHIARYSQITGNPVAASRIFEWGGGYGNMAKLYKRLWGYATYTMVDTRMFSAIQWLYLSCVFGEGEVVLHTKKQDVVTGKINIVPIGLVDELECDTDMFVSTWAISESNDACQKLLVDRGLYGAGRALIGHQGTSSAFPFADAVKGLVGDAQSEPIDFLPGNWYLFK